MSYQQYTKYQHPAVIYSSPIPFDDHQQQQFQQMSVPIGSQMHSPYLGGPTRFLLQQQGGGSMGSSSQLQQQLLLQQLQLQQQVYYADGVPNGASQISLSNGHRHHSPQLQGLPMYSNYNGSDEDYPPQQHELQMGEYPPYEDMYQSQDMLQNDRASAAAPSRTVYLGNVPADITPKELLDHVRSGIIESIKILPSKNCAFISFLDESSLLLFHSDLILKRLTIKQNDIRIGWGKNTQLQPVVLNAVNRYGATRNVYLGNLDPTTTEDDLLQDLSEFGPIDTIKLIPEKKIAFIHFTSILDLIRVVQNLPINEKYQDKKIFYGKDRCAFITKTQQHNAAQYLGLNPNFEHLITNADREFISTALVQQSTLALAILTSAGGANNLGNRTVYLGNLHPDSTIEEICNVVRGGILQNIRLISERHVCFITFIDPIAAAQFFAMSSLHGLIIHNRKIKIGWGKHSGPLSNALTLAVGNGASRNIYVGGLDLSSLQQNDSKDEDPLSAFAEKLRKDFEDFGEIEQINFFVEKNCAFINFTNISNAIKAIDGIKYNLDYENLKINFGKDRCGNIPRQFQNYNVNPNGDNRFYKYNNNGGHHNHEFQQTQQQNSIPIGEELDQTNSNEHHQQQQQHQEANDENNNSSFELENGSVSGNGAEYIQNNSDAEA